MVDLFYPAKLAAAVLWSVSKSADLKASTSRHEGETKKSYATFVSLWCLKLLAVDHTFQSTENVIHGSVLVCAQSIQSLVGFITDVAMDRSGGQKDDDDDIQFMSPQRRGFRAPAPWLNWKEILCTLLNQKAKTMFSMFWFVFRDFLGVWFVSDASRWC